MTLHEVENLAMEIMDFLRECGGIYADYRRDVEGNLIRCIATGQYILHRDESGQIDHFLDYGKIEGKDMETVLKGDHPSNIHAGSIIWVIDHGNKGGMTELRRSIKEIRQQVKGAQGLIYNHQNTGYRFFPSQKGA